VELIVPPTGEPIFVRHSVLLLRGPRRALFYAISAPMRRKFAHGWVISDKKRGISSVERGMPGQRRIILAKKQGISDQRRVILDEKQGVSDQK
jgi:hypothetical protein